MSGRISTGTKRWQDLRDRTLERDNRTCQRCGVSDTFVDVTLHVHHRTPLSEGGENEVSNLEILCKKCHYATHYDGYEDARTWFDDERVEELVETTVLKQREAEVYTLKEQGWTHQEIADELEIAKSTVDEYSRRINDRLERAKVTVQKLVDEDH